MLPPDNLSDARARYNRKWSAWLLLLNLGLGLVLVATGTLNGFRDDYHHLHGLHWVRLLFVVPTTLALLASGSALLLPKPLRPPLWAAASLCLTCTLVLVVLDFIVNLL